MLNYNLREKHILNYRKHEIHSKGCKETVLRPMVLTSINEKVPSYPALIDSGSDKTITYFKPFGEAWGVSYDNFEGEPEDISPLGTETLKAWVANFDVYIDGKYKLNLPVYFLTNKFDEKRDNYPIILGRNGFFKYFDILFREKENKVYLFKNNL